MSWQQNVFPLLIVDANGAFTGVFIYSPSPGPGNLIGSWTAQAGVDPFGNAYPAGLTSEQGNISGTTITASTFQGFNFVIDNQGIRLYQAPGSTGGGGPPPPTPVPYKIGGYASGTNAVQTIPVGAATAAGDFIHVAANSASGGAAVTGVTDSKSNTYLPGAADATQIPTSVWTASGATVALATTDTITVTYASAAGQKCGSAAGVRGLPSSPVDQSVSAAGTTNNPQVTSGGLAEANEIALVAFGTANGGGNPNLGTGLLVLDQQQQGSSQYLTIAQQPLTTSAAFTAGATISAAKWAALLTTLKET